MVALAGYEPAIGQIDKLGLNLQSRFSFSVFGERSEAIVVCPGDRTGIRTQFKGANDGVLHWPNSTSTELEHPTIEGRDPDNESRQMYRGATQKPTNLANLTANEEWKYRCDRSTPTAGSPQIICKSGYNCSRFTEHGSVISNSIDRDG